MSANKLEKVLNESVEERRAKGTLKGAEVVITGIKQPAGEKGYRYLLEGFGDKEFLKMNANAYLGMPLRSEVIAAEEEACQKYGAGPGAVRFINGTFKPHVELEKRLARFHKREAAMIFSSAYATMIGTFPALISAETCLVSDELNHNCIINAIRLSRPQVKEIYKHLDMADMEERIKKNIGVMKRVVIVTDGIFSMRGDMRRWTRSPRSPRNTTTSSPRAPRSSSMIRTASARSARRAAASRNTPMPRASTSSSAPWARPSASTAVTSPVRRRSSITSGKRRPLISIPIRSRRRKPPRP